MENCKAYNDTGRVGKIRSLSTHRSIDFIDSAAIDLAEWIDTKTNRKHMLMIDAVSRFLFKSIVHLKKPVEIKEGIFKY